MSDSNQPAPASNFTSNFPTKLNHYSTPEICPLSPHLLLSSHLSKSVESPSRTASFLHPSPDPGLPRTTFTPTWA